MLAPRDLKPHSIPALMHLMSQFIVQYRDGGEEPVHDSLLDIICP